MALQLPVAHLIATRPTCRRPPSLMPFREVETLFHEFGHGLQHMMTTVEHADASGINGVEWDASNSPASSWRMVLPPGPHCGKAGTTSRRGAAGGPVEKLCRARTYRAGSLMLPGVELRHARHAPAPPVRPPRGKTLCWGFSNGSRAKPPHPPLPENRFLCGSSTSSPGLRGRVLQLQVGRGLSADAFSAFEDAGLDDEHAVTETGRRFRDTVLASGGGRHPMDVFRDFRGREPGTAALLKHNGLA
ncbi:MAG: hypothetical protein CM1200mP2_51750 [Planctomycetaceae bacterium]|nr:MAG: hypothetical protein CM1200mP2_51750 [Planctomycetaceae bacterium]